MKNAMRVVLMLSVGQIFGSLAGCQTRQFASVKSTTTAPGGSSPSSGSSSSGWQMPDLPTGAAKWRDDIVDAKGFEVTVQPSRDYTQDLTANVGAADYYKSIAGRSPNPPSPFAAKTVLAAMRIMRSYTNPKSVCPDGKCGEIGIGQLVRGENPTLPEVQGMGSSLSCTQEFAPGDWRRKCQDGWVRSHGDKEFNTLVPYAQHWSDLQAHYYSITGHRNHGCYTTFLGNFASTAMTSTLEFFADGEKTDAKNLRQAAVDVCAFNRPLLPTAPAMGDYITKLKTEFAGMHSTQWVDPKTGDFVTPDKAPKTYDESVQFKKDGYVNMFEYIMFTQTFGFDLELQQKVINAYYGDAKLFHENKDIEPETQGDCSYWRPARSGSADNVAWGKTRCQAEGKAAIWNAKGY